MAARTWRQGLLAAPGIGIALLPKLACPLCWPAYAAVLSSVGLGFLISTAYLVPLTIVFLILTLIALAFGAKQRRGYGPLGLGLIGSAAVLIGKFNLESTPTFQTGIGILVVAAIWNVWPRRVVESCPCESLKER
jgi:mercuric ion transport protein